MATREPLSDAGLLLSSIFVAVAIVGIGILGNGGGPDHMASVQDSAMLAAASAAPNPCLVEIRGAMTSDGKDYKCLPGCTYTVEISWWGSALQVVPSGKPSQTKEPPGQVYYQALMGGKKGPAICPAENGSVASAAQGNFNDLNTLGYHYVASESTGAAQPSGGSTGVAPNTAGSGPGTISPATAAYNKAYQDAQTAVYGSAGGNSQELDKYWANYLPCPPGYTRAADNGFCVPPSSLDYFNQLNSGGVVPGGKAPVTISPSNTGPGPYDQTPGHFNWGAIFPQSLPAEQSIGETVPGTVSPGNSVPAPNVTEVPCPTDTSKTCIMQNGFLRMRDLPSAPTPQPTTPAPQVITINNKGQLDDTFTIPPSATSPLEPALSATIKPTLPKCAFSSVYYLRIDYWAGRCSP